mmetsp:Transcript_66187/g.191004  ORF Transcript_66187/g.191004 Transcript_66187/m.191004 type:complete len:319 (+) Transcript_66187:133-1089(+)
MTCPFRWTLNCNFLPTCVERTTICTSSKCRIFRPSTSRISSSTWKPAASAGLLGNTISTMTLLATSCDPADILRPRYDRGTFFLCNKFGKAAFAESTGIAKPMPSPNNARIEMMPMTSPASFNKGPPLFPWFTAASVCSRGCRIQSKPVSPVERSLEEIMPKVQVFCKPKGFPKTTAQSPVRTPSLPPSGTEGRGVLGRSFVLIAAKSIASSVSNTSHSKPSPRPANEAVKRSAPCTTCAFVMMMPVAPSMQKPEPWPRTLCCCRRPPSGRMPKKNEKTSALSRLGTSTVRSISTRTTAGPHFSTTRFTKLSFTVRRA